MSLTLAINTALTSLNVNQRSLSVLSQNIANANNKEYSRQNVNQEAIYLRGTGGSGVKIRDVGRRIDEFLQNSVRNQQSSYGRSQTVSDYTERLQVLLGKPGSNNSIYSYTTSFFNSLQSLSQTPENASLRVNAVNLGKTAAREMRTLANGMYDMQFNIDQDIKRAIDVINSSAREISKLNGTISANKLLGRSVSELEDSRDKYLGQIAELIDVQTYTQSNGILNVFTAGGNSLVDENLYEVSYNGASSVDFFSNNNPTSPIQVYRLDESGNRTGSPSTLVTGGNRSDVSTAITGGKIKGLLELRDRQIPDVLAKLDMLASTMRDEMNKVHNSGVAFPGANSYTGTRQVTGDTVNEWTGKMRIAVLGLDGKPVPSTYSNEPGGLRSLLIDFDTLDTGAGPGNASVQGIINEINYSYGVPQNKVSIGDVNDVRLVLNNDSIPGLTPQLNFDFQLENITANNADVYVTDVQVLNATGTDITNITQDVPKIALKSTGTYTTTVDSSVVTVATNGVHGFKKGDRIYLSPPASDVDGIPKASLGGFFVIDNVTAEGFTIDARGAADVGGSFDQAGVTAKPVYTNAESGANARTKGDGTITASLVGQTTSNFYTVKANIAVVNADGTISSSQVTYRIDNLATNTRNYRYAAQAATLDGKITPPNSITAPARAILVDANGNELPIVNNAYSTTERGYLKIVAGNANQVVAIDSLDSAEKGLPNTIPPIPATNRGFSHFFELNNLFTSNRGAGVTDDTLGSALNMNVSKAIADNPNLLSLGKLLETPRSINPSIPSSFTYERTIGDNSIIEQLAKFSTTTVRFGDAGDLGANSQTLTSYAGQMLSTVAAKASANDSETKNSQLLLDGFTSRSDAVRGVNLDEELANTVIYQNAYSASARIITVANEFFDALLAVFR